MAISISDYKKIAKAIKANPTAIQQYEKYIDATLEQCASFNLTPAIHVETRGSECPKGLPELNYKDIEELANIYRQTGWNVATGTDGAVQIRR